MAAGIFVVKIRGDNARMVHLVKESRSPIFTICEPHHEVHDSRMSQKFDSPLMVVCQLCLTEYNRQIRLEVERAAQDGEF